MSRLAFVTGANGFLGLNIVSELTRDGWEVVAMHRSDTRLDYLKAFSPTLVRGDVTSFSSMQQAMPAQVDAVFHTAGLVSADPHQNAAIARVNLEGTRNVVRVALEKKVGRLIHTSSMSTFGFHTQRVTEETPSNALETGIHYFITKAQAEEAVQAGITQGLDAVIINPANMLGAYATDNWARLILLIHEQRLPGVGNGGGSFCHAREVARAHITASEQGKCGERYLLGGADSSFLALAQAIQAHIGGKAPKQATPLFLLRLASCLLPWLDRLQGRVPDLTPEVVKIISQWMRVSSDKAIRELNYRPAPLDEIIQDSCDWLAAENFIQP